MSVTFERLMGILLTSALLLWFYPAPNADASTRPSIPEYCDACVVGGDESFDAAGRVDIVGPDVDAKGDESTPLRSGGLPRIQVTWLEACGANNPNGETLDASCTYSTTTCPPGEIAYWQWVRPLRPPDTPWRQVGERCSVGPPPAAEVALPVVTPGIVLEAFRRLPLPRAKALVQPTDRTLVNFDTIFYTRVQVGDIPLTLLGQPVVVRPKVESYVFRFGDGTSFGPTANAGGPYPRKDITHAYARRGSVTASVVTTYSAQFSVSGGPWQPVPDTVAVEGPGTPVQVVAARSELIAGAR